MADMTLDQVRDWLNNCAISNTPSSDINNEFLGELADAIDAAIKQREQDAKDAARWRKFMDLKSAWVREPLVNARTGEEIHGSVRWTIWMHEAPDMPTVEGAVDAAMAQESGND